VFLGRVLSTRDSSSIDTLYGQRYTEEFQVAKLAVLRTWKGASQDTIEVVTQRTGAACGYPVRVSSRHLLYAYRDRESGRLKTTYCSLSRPEAQAKDQMRQLERLRRATP
jgi:hypothetical protein